MSTAPGGSTPPGEFEVTHPFHPLHGKRFPLLSHWRNWGGDRLIFEDPSGRVRSIPTAWTNLARPDPFVELSGGRSWFRPEDLLALTVMIDRLVADEPECKGDSAESVKATSSREVGE